MNEVLIKIFTWFAFLSIGSTALLLGVTGWMFLVKKMRNKSR